MLYILKFIYSTFLLPPGIFVVLLFFVSGYLYFHQRKAGRILLAVTVLFYLCTTPLLAGLIIHPLETRYTPPEEISGDAIVILGGGATLDTPNLYGLGHVSGASANRLLTGAMLYHALHLPVVVSGGQVFATTGVEARIQATILTGLGVPAEQILVEDQSLNTTENARNTTAILRQHGLARPILVTSAFHMPRSVLQFAKYGTTVTPYPTDYQTNRQLHFVFADLWPSSDALLKINWALKEYIGILASAWY